MVLAASIALALLGMMLGGAGTASAETCTSYEWLGPFYTEENIEHGKNDLWTDEHQWRPEGVPGRGSNCDSVTIKAVFPPKPYEPFAGVYGVPSGTQLANLTLENSTALSGGNVTVHGNFVWRANAQDSKLELPLTVEGESTLAGEGEQLLEVEEEGASLTLDGSAGLSGNIVNHLGAGPMITNKGVLTLHTGASILGGFIHSPEQWFGPEVDLENAGTIAVPSGTATVVGEFDDRGAISTGSGAELHLVGDQRLAPGDSLSGQGKVVLDTALGGSTSAFLANSVTIGPGATLEVGEETFSGTKTFLAGTGSFIGEGSFVWKGADVVGDLSIGKSIATSIGGPEKPQDNLEGTLSLAGPTTVESGVLNGPGVGSLINTGALTLASGSAVNNLSFQQTAGSTKLEGATVASGAAGPMTISGGTLSGHGTIENDLHNTGGTVRPSTTGGTLEVTGSYTQGTGGTLETDIEGTTPGNGFGQLRVGEEAKLAGTINAHPQNGFVANGQSLPAITYAGRAGEFGSLLGGSTYHMAYEPTSANIVFGTLPVPTVTKLKPTSGPVGGGTTVTITGTNFTGASAVSFGSTPAASFTVKSATTITAVAPAESPATVDVRVTAPGGTSAVSTKDHYKFLPTVTELKPNSGPAGGGNSVTVVGTGFSTAAKATTVKFGTAKAATVSCSSSTQCTVVAPAHAAATVDVTVTVNKVTSAKTTADRYTYS